MKIFKTETNLHSFQIIGSLDKMAFVKFLYEIKWLLYISHSLRDEKCASRYVSGTAYNGNCNCLGVKGLLSLHCSTNEIANAKEVSKVMKTLDYNLLCTTVSNSPKTHM